METNSVNNLKKVLVIARHGPRNPIRPLHKLDQSIWENMMSNDENHIAEKTALTKNGREFCKKFGKYLKEQYYDKLKLENKDSAIFYSSKIYRTQDSAILVAKEFCDKELESHELLFHESISADPNVRYKNGGYTGFKQLVKQVELDDDHIEESIELKEFINTHLGDISTNNHFFDIRGTLECYNFEQIQLPEVVTPDILKKIELCAMSYYKNLHKNKEMFCIGEDIHKFAKSLLTDDSPGKFIYISTHDSIVFPLSQHINSEYTKLPNFCSHIKYELYSDNNVKVIYDDKEINSFCLDSEITSNITKIA